MLKAVAKRLNRRRHPGTGGLIGPLAVVIFLALTSTAVFAHGSDHPTELRNTRNQFTYLEPQRPAPPVPILTEDGGLDNLGRFHGKLVLLNFWATWCAPCVDELPALDRLQGRLGTDGLAVVAVSIDESGINLPVSFVRRLGLMNLKVYLDFTGRARDAFLLYGLPITYLIDPDGSVVGYIVGAAKWDSPEAVDFLRHYMRS
jgi:thiol-disulfide isomerase/thioredoxin